MALKRDSLGTSHITRSWCLRQDEATDDASDCASQEGAQPDDHLEEDDEGADKRHHGPSAADDLLDSPGLGFVLLNAAVAGFDFGDHESEEENYATRDKVILSHTEKERRARPTMAGITEARVTTPKPLSGLSLTPTCSDHAHEFCAGLTRATI
jgi:hypothetical protein